MTRRVFAFSTSTQCFAVGTNQLDFAARSLTELSRRFVAFGMLPFACSAFSFGRVREVGDPLAGLGLLMALLRHGEIRTAEEARHGLPRGVARHHELAR